MLRTQSFLAPNFDSSIDDDDDDDDDDAPPQLPRFVDIIAPLDKIHMIRHYNFGNHVCICACEESWFHIHNIEDLYEFYDKYAHVGIPL